MMHIRSFGDDVGWWISLSSARTAYLFPWLIEVCDRLVRLTTYMLAGAEWNRLYESRFQDGVFLYVITRGDFFKVSPELAKDGRRIGNAVSFESEQLLQVVFWCSSSPDYHCRLQIFIGLRQWAGDAFLKFHKHVQGEIGKTMGIFHGFRFNIGVLGVRYCGHLEILRKYGCDWFTSSRWL